MLFCNSEGLPITEHLPEGHEGREIYGVVEDPHPDKGRALGRLEEKQGRELKKRTAADPAPDAPTPDTT
jgi:ferredoxin-thioredoxin reductase catalytic chain